VPDSRTARRRSLITYGLAGAASLGLLTAGVRPAAAAARPHSAAPDKRLAIIGSGMGGVASAYFCDSGWRTDVFESRNKIGGHADTVTVTDNGRDTAVDIGAEFFHPDTHPLYWSLLAEIGALNPDDPSGDLVIEGPASLAIFDAATGTSRFSSGHPLDDLPGALGFMDFSRQARDMTDPAAPWSTTLGTWLDGLDIDSAYKTEVLTPWLASLSCGNTDLVRKQSARAHLTAFAKTFPSTIFEQPDTYNSTVGLAGYLRMLLARCRNTTVLTGTAVQGLEEDAGTWQVRTAGGLHGPYDAVIVSTPPHVAKDFFTDVDGAADLAHLLGLHEYYPSRLVIHQDPAYMPPDPDYWAVQNAAISGQDCEGSVWVSDIYGGTDPGSPGIFKSWAGRRAFDPERIVAERSFLHPLSTPQTLAAIRSLQPLQGERNLYFAGHFTTITDLQETALYSALQAAKALNADGPELASFQSRLSDEGKLGISYDVT
jgi:uncharacterized protein